jgi:hypothetical protein
LVAQGTVTTGVREGTFIAFVLNAAETAINRMVLEWRGGKLLTAVHCCWDGPSFACCRVPYDDRSVVERAGDGGPIRRDR